MGENTAPFYDTIREGNIAKAGEKGEKEWDLMHKQSGWLKISAHTFYPFKWAVRQIIRGIDAGS